MVLVLSSGAVKFHNIDKLVLYLKGQFSSNTVCYFFKQRYVQQIVFYATAYVATLIAYVFWEDPDVVEFRYGIIITVLLMLLIASPLLSLVSSVLSSQPF